MRWMKELVKRKKRIVAVILVLCCLLTCVTEIMLPSTQVIGSETGKGGAGKKVESTEQATVESTELGASVAETTSTETEKPAESVETAVPETEKPVQPTQTPMPETEQTPESTEVLEPETEKSQEPKIREDILARINPRAAAVDRSEDTGELKIILEELNILDAGNGKLSYTTSTSGNNTVYDTSSNAYYDVAKVKFRINFTILKQSDSVGGGRGIREGDYFIYRIPKGFTVDSSIADGMVEFKGLPIAEYKKGTDGTGEFLTFTFQKAVNGEENYNDIAGGMNLELNFNSSSLAGGGNKLVQLLPERAGNTGIQVKLPEEPSTANGITKTGTHNSLDNTITWKIKVATETESKGMTLDGLILEDVMGAGQTYIPASAKMVNADDTPAAGTVSAIESGNKVTLTLTGAKAPCYVELKTAITKEKIDEAIAAKNPVKTQFTNEVTMKPPVDGGLAIGSKNTTTATVDAQFGTSIAKRGVQVNSNTIHWTIQVNDAEPRVHVYRGVVTDQLVTGLSYKSGSMTYKVDGGEAKTPGVSDGSTSPWPGNSLFVSGNAATRQTLKFYLEEDTKSSYTIEFDTTVEEGFTSSEVDGDGKTAVSNGATIAAEFPHWTGSGPNYTPWDYGIPGLNCSFDSSMIEKKVSPDEKTGILTWTIYPSTRTSAYDDAVVTDAIEAKQEYITGTLKVEKIDGSPVGAGIIKDDTTNTRNLKITIPKTAGTLGEYKITYQTKALNFFKENFQEQNYTNTAVLDIMKGGTSIERKDAPASTKMTNRFLAKSTSFEYINNVGYFHYTIDVNGNGLALTNVVVTDDLSACVFTAKADDGTAVAIPASNWEFDMTLAKTTNAGGTEITGKKPTISGTVVTANLGSITEKHTVHLYARLKSGSSSLLTDLTANGLANKKVYSSNTVNAASTEVVVSPGPNYPAVSDSKDKNVFMDNTLVKKDTAGFNKAQALITWNIIINPNGGPLSNPVIKDTLPKSAKFLSGSVRMYHAVYNGGKLEKGTEAAKPAVSLSIDKTNRYMTVTLDPSITGTYFLEYDTEVVDTSKPSVSNAVSMTGGANQYGSAQGKMELSGGNWGTLSTVGKLEITKYDASVGAAMPLSGAEFTVYSDAACTIPEDVGETDASGKLMLYGLEAGIGDRGTYYYIKETKVPSSAYVNNDKVYKVLLKRGATAKITVENIRKTTASGTRAEIVKQYEYLDSSLVSQIVTTFQSEFEVYFYPYGIDKDTGKLNTTGSKKVQFVENIVGEYTYSTAASGVTGTIKNNNVNGKIVLKDIPWGYYGLKETKAPSGFGAYKDMKYFEIKFDAATGNFSVDYSFTASNPTDNKIVNKSISFPVKKYLTGTANYLKDVGLQICKKEADGSLTVVENPLTGDKYEWITQQAEASTGHMIYNLPAGSYVLHEVPEKTVGNLSIAGDISFAVDAYGALTQAGTAVNELTMYDSKITLTVRKEDQFKEEVDGAKITVIGPDTISPTGYNQTVITASGKAVFDDLVRGGVYTISETQVPEGYKKAEDVTIRVSDDGKKLFAKKSDGTETDVTEKVVMVDRKLLVQLKISKLDAFSKKELTGAQFSLFRKADTLGNIETKLLDGIQMTQIGWDMADVSTSVTNPFTGKPLRSGLGEGSYYLLETKVPKGYKAADKTEFEVTVEGELKLTSTGHASIAEDNQEKIQIQDEPLTLRIEKYDGVSSEALVGAEYKISGLFADESATTTKNLTEDAVNQKNNLAGKLLPGEIYKIEETKPPLGYGKIKPAYFMLDASGNVTVTDELGTPEARDDVKELNPVDDKAGTDGALKILDKKTRVDFVKCRLEDGMSISGAKFIITGVFADTSTVKTVEPSADAAGILEGQLIEGNTYVLKEEAPAGYLPLANNVTFTYTAQSGLELAAGSDSSAAVHHASLDGTGYANETLVITNESKQNTSLRLIKYDKEDNSGIAGTVFEIEFTPEGGTTSQKFTYTVPETGTPYEYETAGEKHKKVTSEGEGFLPELKRGTYVLSEVSSGYAYEMGEPPFSCSFTVDDRAKNKTILINSTNAANHTYDLTILGGEKLLTEKGIINERRKGSVTLVKVDAIDKTQYLNGVGFTIHRYKDNDSVIDWLRQLFTGKTYEVKTENWTEGANADGTLTIQGLPWGRYYIAESAPLEDYVLDKTKHEFTIGKDKVNQLLDWTPGKSILNGKIQMIFEKVTQEGKATVGNRIRMYGKFANYSGEYIEWTVGEEPYVIAGELLEGETYVLTETSPFDGYTSAEEISFRYSKSGIQITGGTGNTEVITTPDGNFKMVQKVIPILVAIEKVDETGKMLPGAELKLEHIDAAGTATIVKEWVSSGEAMRIDGMLLAKENCILNETKAPAGYELAQSVSFTVMDTSEVQLITMVDKKEVPKDKDEPQKKTNR